MQGLSQKDLKIIIDRVSSYIENDNVESLQALIDRIHIADIIEILEELDTEEREVIFNILNTEDAAEVLEDIGTDIFSELLEKLSKVDKKNVLDEMSHDNIVDHLGELTDEQSEEILDLLDDEDEIDVRDLMLYDEETAGGLMTTEFVSLDVEYTVKEAIEHLQESAPDAETVYYLFALDKNERLSGVISLRELIVSGPNEKIKDIMNIRVISVNVSDDQEEVAKVVSKYDFLAVPVIDDFDHMLGIVTVDDVIDILEEEATEDILKFVGASEIEADAFEEKLYLRIFNSIRSRLPWLIVTLFGGMLSASIISGYQSALDANAAIAMFIPILAGMGGNVGTQSSTITVRNIAIGNIEGKEVGKTIVHEMSVGLVVGVLCSLIALTSSLFIYDISKNLALIVGLSMWANMLTASTIGTIVPLVFKKIGVDPAIASAPFITMTVDITGLTIYFTLVVTLMERFL